MADNALSKIENLINEFAGKRDRLEGYTTELEALKDAVAKLFPTKLDHRSKYVFEEKLKTAAAFYTTLLSMNQEINRNLAAEIEIRRKLNMKEDGTDARVRDVVDELERRERESSLLDSEQIDELGYDLDLPL